MSAAVYRARRLAVPAVHQTIPLEARHHLVKRGSASIDAVPRYKIGSERPTQL